MSDDTKEQDDLPEHEKDDIFNEGYDDACDGYNNCPYASGSPRHQLWLDGYNLGLKESSEK